MAMISPAPSPNPFKAGPRNSISPKMLHDHRFTITCPSAVPLAPAGIEMTGLGFGSGADSLGHLLGALQAGGELAVGLFDMVLEGDQLPAFQCDAGRQIDAHRVGLASAAQHFIMK